MIKILTIPFSFSEGGFLSKEAEDFIRTRRGVVCKAEFFMAGGKPYWSVFVTYEEEVTERAEFHFDKPWQKDLYEELRRWRKQRADKEGIPPYLIYTNAQIKEIIMKKCLTKEALKTEDGIGDKKSTDYGDETIEIVKLYTEPKEA